MSSDPYVLVMPTMEALIAEYAACWFVANGEGNLPAKTTHLGTVREFCSGCADNVHDTYLDCTVSFACNFEDKLFAHINKES